MSDGLPSGSSAANRSAKKRKLNWGKAKKPTKWTHNVEQILAKRYADGRPQLLLKWVGYPLQQSTWEPIENLSGDCLSMLADFEAAEFAKLNAQTRGSDRRQGVVDSSPLKQEMEYKKTQKPQQRKKQKKQQPKQKFEPMNQPDLSSDLCQDLMVSSDSSDCAGNDSDKESVSGSSSSSSSSSSNSSGSDSDSDDAKRRKPNPKSKPTSSAFLSDLNLPPKPNLSSDGDSDDNPTSLPKPVPSAAPKMLPMAAAAPMMPPVAPVVPKMPPVAPAAPKMPPVASAAPKMPPVTSAAPKMPPVTSAAPKMPPVAPAAPKMPPVSSAAPKMPPVAPAGLRMPPAGLKMPPAAPKMPPAPPNMPLAASRKKPEASKKPKIRPVSMPLLTQPPLAAHKPPISSLAPPARAATPPLARIASLKPAATNVPRPSLKPLDPSVPLSQFEPLDLSQSEQPVKTNDKNIASKNIYKRSSVMDLNHPDTVKNSKVEPMSTANLDVQDLSKSSCYMKENNEHASDNLHKSSQKPGASDEESSKRKKKSQSQPKSSKKSRSDALPLTMDTSPKKSSKSNKSKALTVEHTQDIPAPLPNLSEVPKEIPASTTSAESSSNAAPAQTECDYRLHEMGRWDDALNLQARVQGLQRGLTLEKILKVFKMRGETYLVVKWKTLTTPDAVSLCSIIDMYPHLVIEYFEKLQLRCPTDT
ncbi:verprolin [Drosophila mojavensis]|uniref:Uncharacterized protein, isoform D n=1 Tax=Drosophila mojavensis TaxID=7230 RepID=A0A0Q9XBM4_DROMO|nr:verprolin [Drosophila mojavensis]KRG04985.1 uncharacterized protein Dmoj_GI20781, isoform D [Drosophila mojavensis]